MIDSITEDITQATQYNLFEPNDNYNYLKESYDSYIKMLEEYKEIGYIYDFYIGELQEDGSFIVNLRLPDPISIREFDFLGELKATLIKEEFKNE